ncbi:putative E3 ubiquitin ligase [Globisporangium polare]
MVVPEAEDVDDESSHDHGASLARLRLFLAAHSSSPSKEESDPQSENVSTSTSNATESQYDQDQSDQPQPSPNDSLPEPAIDDDSLLSDGRMTIPALGAVASVSPLSQTTKEFSRVKYLLQCCLPGFRVHDDVVMWDMTNPTLVGQYEQHSQGLLELDSWVAVNDLGAAMGDVHSYGFTSIDANQTAMKFTTGNLQLGLPTKQNKGGATRQLVLCKIAVGRSFVIAGEGEAKKHLPVGYNSFYLKQQQNGSEDHEATVMEPERGYYHEYVLTNPHQILPQYLVRFRFSAVDSKTAAGPCALCEKHSAAVHCRACEAKICPACDQEVHSANKLVSRHKRVPLLRQKARALGGMSSCRATRRRSSTPPVAANEDGEVANSIATTEPQDEDVDVIVAKQLEEGLADLQSVCRFHEGKHVEFYCSVCEVPVCVHCKMVGDHSVGEKGSHRLLTIADAYELSLRESLKSDPLIESRKSVIESKLFTLARSKDDVLRNREQVEAAIRLQCQQALDRLEEEVRGKVSVLDGEALEFQRQLQQIEWTEDSLEDLRSSYSAVEFLGTWNQHKAVRSEQRDFPAFAHGSGAEQVKGDLEIVGRLQVVSGEHMSFAVNGDGAEGNSRHHSSKTSRFNHEAMSGSKRVSNSNGSSEGAEIRKKLLSMKTALPSEFAFPSPAGSRSPTAQFNSLATSLSPQGIQVIEEIRTELLAYGSVPKSSRTTTFTSHAPFSPASPAKSSLRHLPPATPTRSTMQMDMTSTLRGFSIQRARKRSSAGQQSPVGARSSRLVSDAWASLLRQEMSLASPPDDDRQQH